MEESRHTNAVVPDFLCLPTTGINLIGCTSQRECLLLCEEKELEELRQESFSLVHRTLPLPFF